MKTRESSGTRATIISTFLRDDKEADLALPGRLRWCLRERHGHVLITEDNMTLLGVVTHGVALVDDGTTTIVTDDADLDAALKEKVDDLTSQELAEYAHSLGLYPPGYGPTMNPPIALARLPGMDIESDGVLVWDVGGDDQDGDGEE